MILSIALLAQTLGPDIVELPEPERKEVYIEAYIRAPQATRKEGNAFRVMAETLLMGTEEYSEKDIQRFGSQGGVLPRVELANDYAKIEMSLPSKGLDLLCILFEASLTRPTLSTAAIEEAKKRLSGSGDLYTAALDPTAWDPSRVDKDDVRMVYQKYVRPENVFVAIGGGFKPGEGASALRARLDGWKPVERPKGYRYDDVVKPLLTTGTGVAVAELRGKPLTPATPFSSAQILATFALGCGKDCSLWRIVREENALTYRTEAILWPTVKGWVPRLFIYRKSTDDDLNLPGKVRDMLMKDVDSWDDATLKRAQLLAKASLTRNFPFSPWWLDSDGPLTDTLADRVSWRGYLEMIGTGSLDEKFLASTFDGVDLPTLKDQAKKMLDQAGAGVLRG